MSQYLFDSAGRLQRQWGATGGGSGYTADAESTSAYTYDAENGLKTADNIRLASVGTVGPIVSSYTYTSDGRLDVATTSGVAADHAFDDAGNLTSVTEAGVQTTFTYDAANRLQTAVTGSQTTYFSWDTTNGRRTSQGLTVNEQDPRIRYTYTGTGRLATYVDETRSPAVSAAYSYDALGQRTRSVITLGSKTTTIDFTYEGLTLLGLSATESEGENQTSWKITYLYDENGRPYAGIYRDPATSTTPLVFGMVTTDRGDIVELLDANGDAFAAYRYDAWGNPQGTGNVGTGVWSQSTILMSSGTAADIAQRQPLRYAGYCYDRESGTHYLSARHYDPGTRQFLSKDILKADGEESAYQYCGGDPILNIDSSGLAYNRAVYYTMTQMWNEMRLTLLFTWNYSNGMVSNPKCTHGGVWVYRGYWSVFGPSVSGTWLDPARASVTKSKTTTGTLGRIIGYRKYKWLVKWRYGSNPVSLRAHHWTNFPRGSVVQDFTADRGELVVGSARGTLDGKVVFSPMD